MTWAEFEKYLTGDPNMVITIDFQSKVQQYKVETFTGRCTVSINAQDLAKVQVLGMMQTRINQLNCASTI